MYLYQICIFLLGHLHVFLHFFFLFVESLFKKHPIPSSAHGSCSDFLSYLDTKWCTQASHLLLPGLLEARWFC